MRKRNRCTTCGAEIPVERVQAMGKGVDTCVEHSDVRMLTVADVDVDEADGEDMVRSCQSATHDQR